MSTRRLLTAALAPLVMLPATTNARAQEATPTQPLLAVKVKPAGAGSPGKPANAAVAFTVSDMPADTTVGSIKITLPDRLNLSARKLPRCKRSLDEVRTGGAAVCPRAYAGRGSYSAGVFGAGLPNPSRTKFYHRPLVRNDRTLWVWTKLLAASGTSGGAVMVATIGDAGQSLNLEIPEGLRHPVPGTDHAYTDLTVKLGRTAKRSLVRSTGCSGGEHTITALLTFAARDTPSPPIPDPMTLTAQAPC